MSYVSKHFKRREFACHCGCDFDTIDTATLALLEEIRQYFDTPVIVTSGARCPQHNADVGGVPNSQHVLGRAADIQVRGVSPSRVADWVETHHPSASVGRYNSFTHVDTRTNGPARWG